MSHALGSKSIKRNTGRKKAGAPLFDPAVFLATAAVGRDISKHLKKEVIFAQGDDANAVFYIKKGKVKVAVISKQGKEAVVALLGPNEFVGEGCLIGQPKRLTTASAMTECETMRVEKTEIQRVLHDEPDIFADVCLAYSGEECPGRRRPGRSAIQLNRKTACAAVAAVGEFWEGRTTGANSCEDQSGNTR